MFPRLTLLFILKTSDTNIIYIINHARNEPYAWDIITFEKNFWIKAHLNFRSKGQHPLPPHLRKKNGTNRKKKHPIITDKKAIYFCSELALHYMQMWVLLCISNLVSNAITFPIDVSRDSLICYCYFFLFFLVFHKNYLTSRKLFPDLEEKFIPVASNST